MKITDCRPQFAYALLITILMFPPVYFFTHENTENLMNGDFDMSLEIILVNPANMPSTPMSF